MKQIKKYEAKTGYVIVTQYETGEYQVKHSNLALNCATEWHNDRMSAIAHAQFLTRY